MKIVHTADWHWSEQRLDKCQQSSEYIIAQLEAIRPDVHVIAGDYWDKRQVLASSSAVLPAIDAMKRMASISPIVIILGNLSHDAPGSLQVFRDLRTTFPVYASERPETIALRTGNNSHASFELADPTGGKERSTDPPKAIFHLLPYPTKSFLLAERISTSIEESNLFMQEGLRNIFLGFAAIGADYDCPHILVAHCGITGAVISSGQTIVGQDVEVSKNDLALAAADYYALGHIHVNQTIGPAMWYSGSTYHNNFGETERKYFNVVDIRGKTVEIKAVEIPSRPMSLHELRLDACANTLVDENGVHDWEGAELRVRVHLTKEQASFLDDERICQQYPGAWSIAIERIFMPEERIRSDTIAAARTLRDKLKEWAFAVDKEVPNEVFAIADEVEITVRSNIQEG